MPTARPFLTRAGPTGTGQYHVGHLIWYSLIPHARIEPPTVNMVIGRNYDSHNQAARTEAPGGIQPRKHTSTEKRRSKLDNASPVLELDSLRPAETVERPANVPVEEDTRDVTVQDLVAEANDQGD
jgi:hypothetical protein